MSTTGNIALDSNERATFPQMKSQLNNESQVFVGRTLDCRGGKLLENKED